jgi:hypothetical protein
VFNDSQPDRHSSVVWVVKGRTEGTWGYRAQFNSRLRRQSQPAFHFRPRLDTPTRSQNCGSLRKACTENSVLPSISRGSLPFSDHRSSGISFNGLRLLVGNVVRAQCQVSDRGTAPLATAGCTRWNSLFCWSLTRLPLETVVSPVAESILMFEQRICRECHCCCAGTGWEPERRRCHLGTPRNRYGTIFGIPR